MPRFNFNTIALSDAADIEKVQQNFEEIESKAAMLTDLEDYQTIANKTNSLSSSSTNTQYPGAKVVFDTYGVLKYSGTLTLVDGQAPTLVNNRFYAINGLSVNGVSDGDFSFSIIFYWTAGSNKYIDLVGRYTYDGSNIVTGKRYKGDSSNNWSVAYQRNVTYSTTDLTAGTSPLSTGSFYFVYE